MTRQKLTLPDDSLAIKLAGTLTITMSPIETCVLVIPDITVVTYLIDESSNPITDEVGNLIYA